MRSVLSECIGKSWHLEMQTHWRTGCGSKLVKLLKLCESHFSPHVRTWAVYTFMWVHVHVFNVTFNWKEILM